MSEYSHSRKVEAGTQRYWGTVPTSVIARRLNKLTLGTTAWFVEQRLGVTLCRIYRGKRIRWILMLTDSNTTEVIGFIDIEPRVRPQIDDLAIAMLDGSYTKLMDDNILQARLEVMEYLVKRKRRVRPATIGQFVKKNSMEAYDELESMLHCGWVDCGFDKEGTWFYADEMPRVKNGAATQKISRVDAGQELPRAS